MANFGTDLNQEQAGAKAPPVQLPAVCILAGGMGTRLQSVVPGRQKTVADVGGKPCLCHLVKQVARCGGQRVVLCTGHKGEQVRELIGDECEGVTISYSQEDKRLGTAGALALALPLVKGDELIAMNGDSYCGADLGQMLAAHRAAKVQATLAVVEVDDVSRFGGVDVDRQQRIIAFKEKGGDLRRGLINAGIYVLSRQMLAELEPDREISIEREVFPKLLNGDLLAHFASGPFLDIGTPASYAQADRFFKALYGGKA